MTGAGDVRPGWRAVRPVIARALGEPVDDARPLTPAKRSGVTFGARAREAGAIVVKVRESDEGRADEKARWCAAHLPALAARGYPVPAIPWHGMIDAKWQATVQSRLPDRSMVPAQITADGPLLGEVLELVELQAGPGSDLPARLRAGRRARRGGPVAGPGGPRGRRRRAALPAQLPGDRVAGVLRARTAGVQRPRG